MGSQQASGKAFLIAGLYSIKYLMELYNEFMNQVVLLLDEKKK
jgi:hypothetical protein